MTVSAQKNARAATAGAARRKRINRLKKIIIGTIIAAILIPTVLCGVLFFRVFTLKEELREAEAKCEALLETIADGSFHFGDELFPEEAVEGDIEPETEIIEEIIIDEMHTRKVYLTFDDGPSDNTQAILDILKEYNVKATFFVTGQQAVSHPERYQAIVEDGHT